MARNKGTQQRQLWPAEDIVHLLAWLDFTLRHPRISFQETVVDHLNEKYTFTKVEGKLASLWKTYGPIEAPSESKAYALEQVYSHGSESLHDNYNGLHDSIRIQIADALNELENRGSAEASTGSSRPRRNAPRLGSNTPYSSTRSSTIDYQDEKKNQQQIQRLGSGFLTRKRTRGSTDDPFTPPKSTNERRRKQKATKNSQEDPVPNSLNKVQNIPAPICSPPTEAREHRSSVSARFATTIYDSDESPFNGAHRESLDYTQPIQFKVIAPSPDFEALHGAESPLQDPVEHHESEKATRCICSDLDKSDEEEECNWILCSNCKVWQCIKCARYTCEQCIEVVVSKQSLTDFGTQVSLQCMDCDYSGERLQGAILQIEGLKDTVVEKDSELIEKAKDVRILERKVSALKCAQERRDTQSKSPLEAEITKLLEEKDKLQRELGDRDALGSFAKLSTKSRSYHKAQDLVFKLDDVYSYRNKSLVGMINSKISSRLQLGQNKDLEVLIHRAIGAPLGMELTTEQNDQSEKLLQASSEVVLKSLFTSAVREWVFYSDFPCFDGVASDTLRIYRENIASLDGPVALRNLDLATINHLVSEPMFHGRIVPEKANKLANRLSMALAPLFQKDPEIRIQETWDGFATWQSNAEDVQERRDCLIEMFVCALIAKAESCKNIEWYEMVIYPPGTAFDPKTMTAQTMDGIRVSSAPHTTGKVDVCVEAALFAWPREDPNCVEDCLMSGRNFKTQRQRTFEPLMKAVVVLS